MATAASEIWRDLFTKWPEGIARRGVLVSTLNEANPFKSFLLRGEMLLLERTNPDPLGARYVMISFESIHMVKLIDPLKEEILKAAGFVGSVAKA